MLLGYTTSSVGDTKVLLPIAPCRTCSPCRAAHCTVWCFLQRDVRTLDGSFGQSRREVFPLSQRVPFLSAPCSTEALLQRCRPGVELLEPSQRRASREWLSAGEGHLDPSAVDFLVHPRVLLPAM